MQGSDLDEVWTGLARDDLVKLIQRAPSAPLYAHAYAFHLNFRLGTMTPVDLLDWAAAHRLHGVKIHVEDGEDRSLLHAAHSRAAFGIKARDLGLQVHIETSSTLRADLACAIAVANDTGAT